MTDQQNSEYNKIVGDPNGFYLPGAILLDVYHHNQPEMHKFGEAFHLPVAPLADAFTAFEGTSDTPAREDHIHPINFTPFLRFAFVNLVTNASSEISVSYSTAFAAATDAVILSQVFAGSGTAHDHVVSTTASGFVAHFRTSAAAPADVGAGFTWVGFYIAIGH